MLTGDSKSKITDSATQEGVCLKKHHCMGKVTADNDMELYPGPEVIKLFFMLNSFEHKILNAHKHKNIKNFGLFRLR